MRRQDGIFPGNNIQRMKSSPKEESYEISSIPFSNAVILRKPVESNVDNEM